MHHPSYPGHLLFARNALTAAALILFGYRITRAVATGGHWEAATSLAAGLALIGATATGYLIHLREARRRAAEARRQAEQANKKADVHLQATEKISKQYKMAQQEIERLRDVAEQQSRETAEEAAARKAEEASWWADPADNDGNTVPFGRKVIPLNIHEIWRRSGK